MSITFQEAMAANFDTLTSAANGWQRTSEQMGRLGQQYHDHGVRMDGSGWRGEAHDAWEATAVRTRRTYLDAEENARLMAQVIDQGQVNLSEIQRSLRDVVKQAQDDHFRVDGMGRASYVAPPALPAPVAGPEVALITALEMKWTNAIQERVLLLAQADADLAQTLAKLTAGSGSEPGAGSRVRMGPDGGGGAQPQPQVPQTP